MKTIQTFLLATTLTLTLFISSCGETGKNIQIPGVDGPTLSLHEDKVLISIIFENMLVDGGIRYYIPKYKESYIELSPDFSSGGTLMSVSVSLQDIFNNGLQKLDPQRLPGGRPLPGVASGSLPAVAFSIDQFYHMAMYLGPDVFGIFIPFDPGFDQSIATFRYYLGDTRMGNISIVGNDANGLNGGILLLLDMKGAVKKKLEGIAKNYQ